MLSSTRTSTGDKALAIPFLPGNTFRDPVTTKHKRQTLAFKSGSRMVDYVPPERDHETYFPVQDRTRPDSALGDGAETVAATLRPYSMLSMQSVRPTSSVYGSRPGSEVASRANISTAGSMGASTRSVSSLSNTRDITSALAQMNTTTGDLDHKALCYDAYFREEVHDSRLEKVRNRLVKIKFYPADMSVQIVEEKIENSGIWQGVFLRRGRVQKPSGDQYYDVEDFQIDEEVTIFDRQFHIFDADAFTRKFVEEVYGIQLKPRVEVPKDSFATKREADLNPTKRNDSELKRFVEGMLGKASHLLRDEDTLRDFLQYDGKVLRFYLQWDDGTSTDVKYVLVYYLSDKTVQILEVQVPNSGKDPFPTFLRRQRMPKNFRNYEDMYKSDFLREIDLSVGQHVNVLGRDMFIYDCDEFTRKWYKEKHGIHFTPINTKNNAAAKKYEFKPPPHDGKGLCFGSEEDTLQNCLFLIPKPPKRDIVKILKQDRKILRFQMTINQHSCVTTDDPVRRFILNFFLQDDTMSVYEESRRNSGRSEGTVLRRSMVRNESGKYFKARDLFVGATINVCSRIFDLVEADEFTLAYMESVPKEFPQSNVVSIFQKLHQSHNDAAVVKLLASQRADTIPEEKFSSAMLAINIGLSEHEIITLHRYYDPEDSGDIQIRAFINDLQQGMPNLSDPQSDDARQQFLNRICRQLRDVLYGKKSLFIQTLRSLDLEASGTVSRDELESSMSKFGVKLTPNEYTQLLEYIFVKAEKRVSYMPLLEQLVEHANTYQLGPVLSRSTTPGLWIR